MSSIKQGFSQQFQQETMMGPNSLLITEELSSYLSIDENSRLLDLGCGKGLSSLFLAKKYQATVFAADLWIDPTENYRRFCDCGLADKIIPLTVDVTKGLPFAQRYFDLLITVDSYHYYGNNETMLPSLLPYIKRGGYIAMAVPGLKEELNDGVPPEMRPFWQPDMNFYTCHWWRRLWEREANIEITVCREMDCLEQAWRDWLACPEPHAQADAAMMAAEGGRYFNLVQLIAKAL